MQEEKEPIRIRQTKLITFLVVLRHMLYDSNHFVELLSSQYSWIFHQNFQY